MEKIIKELEEKWFQKAASWVDFLKLRASWGMTGRDNTAAWQWMQVYAQDANKGIIFGTGANIDSGSRITINKNNSAVNRDVLALISEVHQRGHVVVDNENDIAALAAVAAVGSAVGNAFIAHERNRAVAAVAGVKRNVKPVAVFAGGLIRRRGRRAQQRRRQHQRQK